MCFGKLIILGRTPQPPIIEDLLCNKTVHFLPAPLVTYLHKDGAESRMRSTHALVLDAAPGYAKLSPLGGRQYLGGE